MDKQLAIALVERFSSGMSTRLQSFQMCDLKAHTSNKMWCQQATPQLTLFISLQLSTTRNVFHIELAWSNDGHFPFQLGIQADPAVSRGRLRLSRLWAEEPKMLDEWSVVPSRTPSERRAFLGKIQANDFTQVLQNGRTDRWFERLYLMVDDALENLVGYGVPFFQKVIREAGAAPPSSL